MKRRILAVIFIAAIAVLSVSAFSQTKKGDKPEQAKDPVCGLMVDKNPELSVNYKGETYYFCLKADLETFKENPEKYVKKK